MKKWLEKRRFLRKLKELRKQNLEAMERVAEDMVWAGSEDEKRDIFRVYLATRYASERDRAKDSGFLSAGPL